MKVEYINPFIKASKEVFNMAVKSELKVGKPNIKATPFPLKEVLLIVGITGNIKGQVVISMDIDTARALASKMMMGMPVEELNDMAKSAISELSNMIIGNTATLFANSGIECDITPPTLMVGKDINLSFSDSETLELPLTTDVGSVIFDIAIKEGNNEH